jgi:hypothetical protein
MSASGEAARRGLVTGLAATVAVAASAVRHTRWWFEWHARARPGDGSRDLGDDALLGPSLEMDESAV